MTRLSLFIPAVAVLCAAGAHPAAAQTTATPGAVRQIAAAVTAGALHGRVLDDRGDPLAGAVVSAVGATSVFAVSERDGAFSLRNLPAGPYLLRAHLQGYIPTRGRIVQVTASTRNVSAISLTRNSTGTSPQILEAGLGPSSVSAEAALEDEAVAHDQGEVAWRLRHSKRSVLKGADWGVVFDDVEVAPFEGAGGPRTFGSAAAIGAGWFAELALNGQLNLLTRTSFDRPIDLFSLDADVPRGITYVSLSAPTVGGSWAMRGAMTQGDLSSWILSGAYVRRAPAAHRYETGLSYGTQRYRGGNAAALAALPDGTRNVGAVYAYDNWSIVPGVDVSYGAEYARYDYLADRALLSPRASVVVSPVRGNSFRIRGAASRREIAPGAEEFLPPSTGLWLPPERTFSPLTPHAVLDSERVGHFDVAVEGESIGGVTIGARAFRESVDGQVVTLFGVTLPGTPSANIGHYYVASGGSFEAVGWGFSLRRAVADKVRASLDYTETTAEWGAPSPDMRRLALAAPSALRAGTERVHDLTASLESEVPSSATRVLFVYKINSAFASGEATESGLAARFQLQVNQSLPFLNFSNAQWEMLVAVRNLFSDDFREGSVYDELLVVRPPKRFVGGLTVRF